jgi:hypothetical protein
MKVSRVTALASALLVAVSAWLATVCVCHATPVAEEVGAIDVALHSNAAQDARDWLGKDCGDARILYYADGSMPGLLKVRNRLDLAAVLDTRLRHLRLSDAERWDPKKTVYGLEFSADVRREAKRLGADLVGPLPFSAWAQGPGGVVVVSDLVVAHRRDDPTPPPLPGEFNGVTLEQALDQVAKKLTTTVVVGECDKPRRLDIVYY